MTQLAVVGSPKMGKIVYLYQNHQGPLDLFFDTCIIAPLSNLGWFYAPFWDGLVFDNTYKQPSRKHFLHDRASGDCVIFHAIEYGDPFVPLWVDFQKHTSCIMQHIFCVHYVIGMHQQHIFFQKIYVIQIGKSKRFSLRRKSSIRISIQY